jgi:high-affinity nickel-transport protein
MSNFDINRAGFAIAGLFVVVWAVALCYWRISKVESRWATASMLDGGGGEAVMVRGDGSAD